MLTFKRRKRKDWVSSNVKVPGAQKPTRTNKEERTRRFGRKTDLKKYGSREGHPLKKERGGELCAWVAIKLTLENLILKPPRRNAPKERGGKKLENR